MPGRLKTGQAPGEKWHSIAVLMPLAAEGISWALSGFAAGRRLNQHSETALCLLFPVRRSAAIRFCPVDACACQHVVGTVRSGSNQTQILYINHTVLQFVESCRRLCKNKAPSMEPVSSCGGGAVISVPAWGLAADAGRPGQPVRSCSVRSGSRPGPGARP